MTFANQNPSEGGHPMQHRGPQRFRRRYRRHLQQQPNNTNNNNVNEIPTPLSLPVPNDSTTRAPSPNSTNVTDHEEPIAPLLYRTFVSLQWSMIRLPDGESQSPTTKVMANWLLQDFLCNQHDDGVWMANSMDLLKNDCSSLRDNEADFETLFESHGIILWNEPIVVWYSELLENTQGVHYEVWNVQYPLFINWNNGEAEQPSMEDVSTQLRSAQLQLQTTLDDQIQMGKLQSIHGIPSVVGRELETFWLLGTSSQTPKLPPLLIPQQPPLLGGQEPLMQESPGTLRPYDTDLIVIIGGLIALLHTLLLVFLHLVLRPCLRKRIEKEKREEQKRQTEMTGKSEGDFMQSFLAPNYWLNGQPQRQPPQPHDKRHHPDAVAPSHVSPQMLDDDSDLLSLSCSSLERRGGFSPGESHNVAVSLLGSSQQGDTSAKQSFLWDPKGQSSSITKTSLDPPPQPPFATIASYLGGNNKNNINSTDQRFKFDKDSTEVLSC